MRITIRRRLLATLLLGLAAACAPGARESASTAPAVEAAGVVHVTNDGQHDVVLYMLRDGARYRLGRVSRMETVQFSIPSEAIGERPSYRVQLLAEPAGMGNRPFATRPLIWRPGQNLSGRVAGTYPGLSFVLVTG